jgi:hypothetical protein
MWSLAVLALIMLSLVAFSPIINFLLTSRRIQVFSTRHRGLTIVRRIYIGVTGFVGILIAGIYVTQLVAPGPKLFALVSMGGNIYAFIREIKFSKNK